MQKIYELDNITELEKSNLIRHYISFDEDQRIEIHKKAQKIFIELNSDYKRAEKASLNYSAFILSLKKTLDLITVNDHVNDNSNSNKIKRKKANRIWNSLLLKKNYIFELRDMGYSLRDIEKKVKHKINDDVSHTYIAKFLKKEA